MACRTIDVCKNMTSFFYQMYVKNLFQDSCPLLRLEGNIEMDVSNLLQSLLFGAKSMKILKNILNINIAIIINPMMIIGRGYGCGCCS